MNKTVLVVIVVALALVIVCIGAATADSCKRNNRACFGNSQQK